MVNFFDYIFWRFYCFFCKHKFFKGMESADATSMLYFLIAIPLFTSWGFLMSYNVVPNLCGNTSHELRINMSPFVFALMAPFIYRYDYKKTIKNNHYQLFRNKWGNEPLPIRKRRKWLIIALYVFNCIVIPLSLILVEILQSRKLIIMGHLIQW